MYSGLMSRSEPSRSTFSSRSGYSALVRAVAYRAAEDHRGMQTKEASIWILGSVIERSSSTGGWGGALSARSSSTRRIRSAALRFLALDESLEAMISPAVPSCHHLSSLYSQRCTKSKDS